MAEKEAALRSLGQCKFNSRELLDHYEADIKRQLARHAEEKATTEQMIKSLEQSQDILKKEKKRIKAELQAALQTATTLQQLQAKAKSDSGANGSQQDGDVVDLQSKLIDLNNRLLDIDFELKSVASQISACTRPDEKELLSIKVVVLQDTKRILNGEIDALRSNIFRIETAAKAEADKKNAEESGYAALGRVEEQLQKISARIDALKQQIYFPAAKGYRFSGGSAGVYIAAQDMFLSEVTKPNGTQAARISVSVEGASNAKEWAAEKRADSGCLGAMHTSKSFSLARRSQDALGKPPLHTTKSVMLSQHSTSASQGSTSGANNAQLLSISSDSALNSKDSVHATTTERNGDVTADSNLIDSNIFKLAPSLNSQTDTPNALNENAARTNESLQPNTSDSVVTTRTPQSQDTQPVNPRVSAIVSHLNGMDSPITVVGSSNPATPFSTTAGHSVEAGSTPNGSTHHGGGPDLDTLSVHSTNLLQLHGMVPGASGSNTPHAESVPAQETDQNQPATSERPATQMPTSTETEAAQLAIDSGFASEPSVAGQQLEGLNSALVNGLSQPPIEEPPVGSQHSRSRSMLSGLSFGDSQSSAGGNQRKKGEMVAGFLNSISKRKDKFKDILNGNSSDGPGALQTQSSGEASQRLGSFGVSNPTSPSAGNRLGLGKLRENIGGSMGRMREGLGGRMEKMREGLGDVRQGLGGQMGRMREGFGERMDKVRESLQEGVQDGRGKLNKLASVLGPKGQPGSSLLSLGSRNERTSPLSTFPGIRLSSDSSTAVSQNANLASQSAFLSTETATAVVQATAEGSHMSMSNAAAAAPQVEIPNLASQRSLGAGSDTSSTAGHPKASSPAAQEPNFSIAFEAIGVQPTRRGLYVQMLGEKVQLIGERGTRVPDLSVTEIMLAVEVSMNATLEWTAIDGWQVPDQQPLELNILQLDHHMRGNSIPLPKTALKGLLNMFLPGVVTKLLVSALPPELGQYVVQSGEKLQVSGEFQVRGPSLATYMAPLAGPAGAGIGNSHDKVPPADPVKRAEWHTAATAAAVARHLLGLTEAQAEAVSELFSGQYALLDPPRPASICELCRLWNIHGQSSLWGPLAGQFQKAMQASFELHNVPVDERFSFMQFMTGPVARLVRKPVQVAFMIDTLKVNLDVDVGLNTLRDLLERLLRDLHKRANTGDERVAVPTEPLEVQLDALNVWHAALAHQLRVFKARFRAASCSIITSADKQAFQFGAEGIAYDGPLRLRVPLDLVVDPDHAFVVDVKLPNKETYFSNITSLLREVVDGLAAVVEGNAEEEAVDTEAMQQQLSSKLSGIAARQESLKSHSNSGAGKAGTAVEVSKEAEHLQPDGSVTTTCEGASNAALAVSNTAGLTSSNSKANPSTSLTGEGSSDMSKEIAGKDARPSDDDGSSALQPPLLESPVVGQLFLKKLAVSLRLDEERLAELLDSGAGGHVLTQAVTPAAGQHNKAMHNTKHAAGGGGGGGVLGTLLGSYGDLFSMSFDVGWKPDNRPEAEEGATQPACMLTIANNEVTRVMASLESMLFQSTVSPQVAVGVLHAVMRGILLRYYPADSYQVKFWQHLFQQLNEYLAKNSLNALACLSARLEVVEPAVQNTNNAVTAGQLAVGPSNKLRLMVHGDSYTSGTNSNGSKSSPNSKGSPPTTSTPPVYLINEINLMTILDSVRLLAGPKDD